MSDNRPEPGTEAYRDAIERSKRQFIKNIRERDGDVARQHRAERLRRRRSVKDDGDDGGGGSLLSRARSWIASALASLFGDTDGDEDGSVDGLVNESNVRRAVRDPYRLPEMDLEPLSRSMRVSHIANAERAHDAVERLRALIMQGADEDELERAIETASTCIAAIAGRVIMAKDAVQDLERWIDESGDQYSRETQRIFMNLIESREFKQAFIEAAGEDPDDTHALSDDLLSQQVTEIISRCDEAEIGRHAVTAAHSVDSFSDEARERVVARVSDGAVEALNDAGSDTELS